MRSHTVVVERHASGVDVAVAAALPSCFAQGETYEEAYGPQMPSII